MRRIKFASGASDGNRGGLRTLLFGPSAQERAAAETRTPMPGWFSELDDHDDSGVIRLAFDGDLDEVLAERASAPATPERRAPGEGARRSRLDRDQTRKDGRGRCPRTR